MSVLLFFPCALLAEFDTGMELLQWCNAAKEFEPFNPNMGVSPTQKTEGIFCMLFIKGIRSTNNLYRLAFERNHVDTAPFFCEPLDATNQQIAMVVAKYLDANPEKLHERDYLLVVLALQDAYPCNE
jgi:hypothetical protein